MKKAFFIFLTLFIASVAFAQDPEPYEKKSFVIIKSTKSYVAAKKVALEAAKKLEIKLDLRELVPHKKNGLTFTKKKIESENSGLEIFGYPIYIARGRFDDGEYVSIEWSNAYENFSKGYYIVILASGDDSVTKTALTKAKKVYKDAFVKISNVYVGCMH